MAKWWQMLEEKFGAGPGGPSRMNTVRWLLIAAGVGIIIMLLNSFMTVKEMDPTGGGITGAGASPPEDRAAFSSAEERYSQFSGYEASYENEIKEILSKIVGVGEVDVLVTVDSTEEIIIEHNMSESRQMTDETDAQGAKRHITSTSKSGDVAESNDSPIVKKTVRPKIRGVVVVAEGAENMTVKKMIHEAVSKGMDVPANKISIVPSKR
ncbi:stage III sporulation protein AG [Paenibacillus thermotolerans]|uniref:stage III sporulation protein AG n=1 Tax=Paenibacillus thermotolerans TaxID=3027807 RepID=UPI0023674AAE|nr:MULTISPECIES: stage III sporulation protein AG [unclassified Paenibacillus]